MRDDLRGKLGAIRNELRAIPDSFMFAEFPDGADRTDGLPEGLADLLSVTDGPRAGMLTVCSTARLPGSQFYCDDIPALAGGRIDWLCFAIAFGVPLMIERATGAVWWFPVLDSESYPDSAFERLTGDVGEFVDHYVLGPGYREISPSDDDWWTQFLTRTGRI